MTMVDMLDWHTGKEGPVVQERAFWGDKPCELVSYHAPTPSLTEYHHTKPVFLQNKLYGHIVYGADKYLCANCHDSVHEWLYWLLGMRRAEPRVGRAAKAEAQRTYEWYRSELDRLKLITWENLK